MKKAIITLTFLSLCLASVKADYISDMKRKERIAKDPQVSNINYETREEAYSNCSKNRKTCRLCDQNTIKLIYDNRNYPIPRP